MDGSIIVRILRFPALFIFGDTLVLDRWRWIKRRLPKTARGSKEKLLDVGCGSGAFTIGSSLRGYRSLGLSWDKAQQQRARKRASILKADAHFQILDVRKLDTKKSLREKFDVAICCENIEHIINDLKLMKDISACLKPGGRLLLTTPYLKFKAMTKSDNGPYLKIEDGRHVRRGYSSAMLKELCEKSGLKCEEISSCSGFFSQKITKIYRVLSKIHPVVALPVILPLRIFPPLLDRLFRWLLNWPDFSICVEAYKPRYR